MAYDISVMRTDINGNVDYRFSGMNGRIVGREKLAQWFIKCLYADNIGGLLRLARSGKMDEASVRLALVATGRHVSMLQSGKALSVDERYNGIAINKVIVGDKFGKAEIEFVLKSPDGGYTVRL